MKEYKASSDLFGKATGLAIFLTLSGLSIYNIRVIEDTGSLLVHLGAIGIILALLVISFMLAPVKYQVDDQALYIVRRIGNIRIPLSQIKEARLLDDKEIHDARRKFAAGGMFGYYGRYQSDALGNFIQYSTQTRNRILIRTATTKYVISPDDTGIIRDAIPNRPIDVN